MTDHISNQSAPLTYAELTEAEKREVLERGFRVGHGVRYIVKKRYGDCELKLVRWVQTKREQRI
ncbi:hypothetical protein [Sphingobium baderi]|uniref:Uncharacterized protein n=1 Tax=Sphingobium baderi TaxID=1332080 RepID=A0A0S3F5Y3_9SPHN|nr:hypothetical protein [Sphingobium baderi]ALR23151.1 hypothetical protein ATN00_21875 [Sphingobium baderi]